MAIDAAIDNGPGLKLPVMLGSCAATNGQNPKQSPSPRLTVSDVRYSISNSSCDAVKLKPCCVFGAITNGLAGDIVIKMKGVCCASAAVARANALAQSRRVQISNLKIGVFTEKCMRSQYACPVTIKRFCVY
jgi:hypothetical protein